MHSRQIVKRPVSLNLPMGSAALGRLVAEVTAGESVATRGYNRTYNRHNR